MSGIIEAVSEGDLGPRVRAKKNKHEKQGLLERRGKLVSLDEIDKKGDTKPF